MSESKMNPILAAMYDTHGVGTALHEEQTKIAHLELFAKCAAAEGIQLEDMTPEAREELYKAFTEKLAEEGSAPPPFPPKEGGEEKKPEEKKEDEEEKEKSEEEKKEAAARAEYEKLTDHNEKVAEADFLGRVMAHAFHQERQEIEKAGGAKDMLKNLGNKAKETGKKLTSGRPLNKAETVAATGGGMALGAAGGVAAKKAMDKKASAFDTLAVDRAVKLAEAGGYDVEEAKQRLDAVLTLGLNIESTKTAQVTGNYDAALSVRGLEFLEAAGYQVNWDQVFAS